jgi:hypothetical protein
VGGPEDFDPDETRPAGRARNALAGGLLVGIELGYLIGEGSGARCGRVKTPGRAAVFNLNNLPRAGRPDAF